jgi:hypothetical protein
MVSVDTPSHDTIYFLNIIYCKFKFENSETKDFTLYLIVRLCSFEACKHKFRSGLTGRLFYIKFAVFLQIFAY